jgi:hypothetical protein
MATVTKALHLPGTASNWASAPDSAALDIVGDLELRVRFVHKNGTLGAKQALIAKWTPGGNQRSYMLVLDTSGGFSLYWSTDGTLGNVQIVSSSAHSFEEGDHVEVRATLDVDNGASGHDVTFYVGVDEATPTILGSTITNSGTTSIHAGTGALEIGSSTVGTADNFGGSIFQAQVLSGIAGTVEFNAEFDTTPALEATSFTESSANAATVTINQTGTDHAQAEIREVTYNYGWDLPTQGSSTDAWGTPLNEIFGDVNGLVRSIDEVLNEVQTEITSIESRIDTVEDRVDTVEAGRLTAGYARVYRSTLQIIPHNVETTITWDTESLDQGGYWASGAPTRLTVPSAHDGLFQIRGVLTMTPERTSSDDGTGIEVHLYKNGAEIAKSRWNYQHDGHTVGSSGPATVSAQLIDEAQAGDYFEMKVLQYTESETGTKNTYPLPNQTYFEIARLPGVTIPAVFVGEAARNAQWHLAGRLTHDPAAQNNTNITGTDIHLQPMTVGEDMTVDTIGFYVWTAGTGNFTVCIYNSTNGNTYPGSLLFSGTVSIASTGLRTVATGGLDLKANQVYWVGLFSGASADPTIQMWAISSSANGPGNLGVTGVAKGTDITWSESASLSSYFIAGAGGVPDPFTSSVAVDGDESYVPWIWFRRD